MKVMECQKCLQNQDDCGEQQYLDIYLKIVLFSFDLIKHKLPALLYLPLYLNLHS